MDNGYIYVSIDHELFAFQFYLITFAAAYRRTDSESRNTKHFKWFCNSPKQIILKDPAYCSTLDIRKSSGNQNISDVQFGKWDRLMFRIYLKSIYVICTFAGFYEICIVADIIIQSLHRQAGILNFFEIKGCHWSTVS